MACRVALGRAIVNPKVVASARTDWLEEPSKNDHARDADSRGNGAARDDLNRIDDEHGLRAWIGVEHAEDAELHTSGGMGMGTGQRQRGTFRAWAG